LNWLIRRWRFFRCRCLFKHFCRILDLHSETCMCGGKDYCGAHLAFSRCFEDACAGVYGRFAVLDWQPWGKCLIIQRSDFNRHIAAFLLARGYRLYWDVLDGCCVVVVPLRRQRAKAQESST